MGKANPIKIIKDVVKTIVNVFKSVIKFVGDIVGFVFNPMGAFDTPTGPTNPEQEAQGVTISKTGTNQPIPVVYGYRRVGGNLIFVETNGTSNKYLYCVYALCEGEIEGVKKILVEDVELTYPSGIAYTHGQVYTITEGRFANRIQFQVFNGTEAQVQSSLANETPNWPTKARRLPGVAYVVFRFEWKEIKTQDDANNNPFSGGIPKVQFDILGKKVYDIRTHSTGKTLADDYANLIKGYSFNPANCLLDYMMNPRFGCGLTKDEIDAETFKTAALKYEQTVTYYTGQTGRAMTLNYVVNTENKLFDNVKALLGGCRGIMPYVQGRYKLKVEDGGNATDITSTTINVAFDVDKSHIIGGITMQGERKDSKFNEVLVNYVDPDLNFSNQQVYYSVNGDVAADGNETLRREFTFSTLTNKSIAQDLAKLIYLKSRTQRSISFSASQELLQVEVGDIIRVTDTVLGLNLDTFRVVDIKLNLDLTVDIQAVEHDATVYPFTSSAQVETPPPLFLPDELAVRPRTRTVSLVPIGIVPPVDPDDPEVDSAGNPVDSAGNPVDSAGQIIVGPPVEINPPPPIIDPVETAVTEFKDVITFPSSNSIIYYEPGQSQTHSENIYNYYNRFIAIDSNAGLGRISKYFSNSHYTENKNGVVIRGRNSFKQGDYDWVKENSLYVTLGIAQWVGYLNLPKNTAFTSYKIEGYLRDGTAVSNSQGGVEGRPLTDLLRVYFRNYYGSFDNPKFFYFQTFRWVKTLSTGDLEIPDGSDLGQDYTYYDAREQRNKTGRNIEAWLNYYLQNPNQLFGLSSTPSVNATSVQTSHNLGV